MVDERISSEWTHYTKELGLSLQRARYKRSYSQEYVASAAGISGFTYWKMEKGESNPGTPANPRLKTLLALSRVLEIPLSELLPNDVNMPE
jgi:transcriptional regulator with XRE-family HTH domain